MGNTPDFVMSGALLRAVYFASQKHRDQRRKDPAASPYINHPVEVAYILWFEGGVRDEAVLVGAVLHDTVEDTDTSLEEVARVFGETVCGYVDEVSDDTSLSRKERKAAQLEHAAHISQGARLIKLGDKISNVRDIVRAAPKGWSDARCAEYFNWCKAVVDRMRGTNAHLEAAFDTVYQEHIGDFA
ncbi:HD domain-containing protein [Acanthopleuribacter pedis]|uniref:Bifunctional (P)ppGpp synthetase/guanosine-3',5'-bis(Diphosphate) 3'-pyrophosphohydrolase n=1 Tax=Acanthopleuribacter pedis TaxID=442870 RepID=A0A8J7QAD6_9BACT|nr:HD domain-containing protein [Acanthopleuribacter pedis]MBO1321751.1 bifunctional (p)ppGpp synthetase/guanosine-3',5'-bis(diphosphate) 3'-pyrophosphohydrolase [Acanthopleuribacter pedis]